jgi:hypothetical protein
MNHYIAAQYSERIKLAKEWLNCHTPSKKNETPNIKEQEEQDQN